MTTRTEATSVSTTWTSEALDIATYLVNEDGDYLIDEDSVYLIVESQYIETTRGETAWLAEQTSRNEVV